ncbi:MAG: peptidoglycan-binding protein [Pseudomonadota bacterium]
MQSTAALLCALTVNDSGLAQSRADIKFVQDKLSAYGISSPDAVLDVATRNAIRAYQRDWQVPETGRISDQLVAMLKREHPRTKAQWLKVSNQDCEVWNAGPQPQEKATWTGGCVTGRLDGAGKLTWRWTENGHSIIETYVGEYRQGKINGRGIYTWSSGSKYDGEWLDGDYHGHGIYVWGEGSEWSGDRYEGEYRNGKRHGRGSHKFANGNEYDGEWRDGKRHGRGVFSYASSNKYSGQWRYGKAHGRGVWIQSDGTKYSGEWQDGEKHGRGIQTWVNGEVYDGEWQNGKPHGQGIFVTAEGKSEARRWHNGCSNLNGHRRWIATSEKDCGF